MLRYDHRVSAAHHELYVGELCEVAMGGVWRKAKAKSFQPEDLRETMAWGHRHEVPPSREQANSWGREESEKGRLTSQKRVHVSANSFRTHCCYKVKVLCLRFLSPSNFLKCTLYKFFGSDGSKSNQKGITNLQGLDFLLISVFSMTNCFSKNLS